MIETYLATLNPEQRHAVEYGGDQPLLIIAGAGSGKTLPGAGPATAARLRSEERRVGKEC